ncbi:MAG: RnfH family protein [Povalibacter sp.]
MRVRVVYAVPEQQTQVSVDLQAGATVADAVARAALSDRFVELAGQVSTCAIFGRIVEPTHVLSEGDRIEILRPLQIDPKQSRRKAAAGSKASSRGRSQ